MKTLVPLSFIAAFVAFLIFPLRFEIVLSVLVAAGSIVIAVSDYTPRIRPLRVPAPAGVPTSRKERFGLAA